MPIPDFSESVKKIEKAFQNTPPDILTILPILGCCSEHAASFEWYRDHEWKDLRKEIRENAGDFSKGLDPVEFGSLDPIAFHYFLPGVLTGIADIIKNEQRLPDLLYYADSYCQAWLSGASPQKRYREQFRSEKLPLFTKEERSAVRNFLETFAVYLEGSSENPKEIKELLEQVWN